jgi:hypothetical protein
LRGYNRRAKRANYRRGSSARLVLSCIHMKKSRSQLRTLDSKELAQVVGGAGGASAPRPPGTDDVQLPTLPVR